MPTFASPNYYIHQMFDLLDGLCVEPSSEPEGSFLRTRADGKAAERQAPRP